jgi:hypothetical protein
MRKFLSLMPIVSENFGTEARFSALGRENFALVTVDAIPPLSKSRRGHF